MIYLRSNFSGGLRIFLPRDAIRSLESGYATVDRLSVRL